ncbi:MAG TPA: hypothetical protein VMW67_01340 [Desulfobacteria bacterium]|nr:hypothetical protein [Desulfobacteria bacterium]
MKKLIVRSQRTSLGTIHHLRVEGVQDINDVRTIYNELPGAREKIHYNTKFYKGTLELVVGNVDINQLLETGGYEKAKNYIIA